MMIADRTKPSQHICDVDSLDSAFKSSSCSFNDLTYSEIKKRVLNNGNMSFCFVVLVENGELEKPKEFSNHQGRTDPHSPTP